MQQRIVRRSQPPPGHAVDHGGHGGRRSHPPRPDTVSLLEHVGGGRSVPPPAKLGEASQALQIMVTRVVVRRRRCLRVLACECVAVRLSRLVLVCFLRVFGFSVLCLPVVRGDASVQDSLR